MCCLYGKINLADVMKLRIPDRGVSYVIQVGPTTRKHSIFIRSRERLEYRRGPLT